MVSKIYKSIICLVAVPLIFSCKKFTEIDPPKNAISTEQVFADDQSANSAVLGIYSTMNAERFGYGDITLNAGISSDELLRLNPNSDALGIMENRILASNQIVEGLWNSAYKIIGQANACLEGLNAENGVSAAKKTTLIAESRFLRAFCYFYLVNLYGKVPLITTTNWTTIKSIPRAEVAELSKFILEDLKFAYESLPVEYPSGTKSRATKWAAAAMLARVNLYSSNWAEASSYAAKVIDESGLFHGELPAPSAVFLTGSTEAIWQMPPASYWVNTFEGTAFNNFGYLQYVISDDLKSALDPDDLRTIQWVDRVESQGVVYAVPAKYKANTYAGSPVEQYVMLRLAEQFLIRAEAEAKLNHNEPAIADLNVIRNRAAISALPDDLSNEAVIAAVEDERRMEFFAEWGHRWFDLKRTPGLSGSGTRADEVIAAAKPGKWQSTDALYPVPQKEISFNPALAPNNPGY